MREQAELSICHLYLDVQIPFFFGFGLIQNKMQCFFLLVWFGLVWSHPGIQHTFSLLHPSRKNKSRGEEGELRVERKAKLFKKTHTHTQTIQNKSRSPTVQNLLLQIKHFLTGSQCSLPPPESSRPPREKYRMKVKPFSSLRRNRHTENTFQGPSGGW